MTDPDLPEDLRKALEGMKEGVSKEVHAALEESFRNVAKIESANRTRPTKSHVEMARLLVRHAYGHLDAIRRELSNISSEFTFTDEPDILYTHLFEDLESALDYMAFELVDRCGIPPEDEAGLRQVTFPYRNPEESSDDFLSKVDRNLPGVRSLHPEIIGRIATIVDRPYLERPWLWRVARIVNQLKHRGFPSRKIGVTYTKSRMRKVGNTWVAVRPDSLWDAVPDSSGMDPVFNLSEFAAASIEFVSAIVEEVASAADTVSR